MGRRGEAARVFSEMGHPALAAIELEAAGAAAAARLEWERVLRDQRLAGRPYETALAHLSLGEALLRIGDRAGGLRELGTAARLLEVVADEYETGGDTERAFDCYRVLLQLGKDMGSFETVAEGYLNMIRIMAPSTRNGRSSTTTTSSRTRSRTRSGTRRRWRRARWPNTACGWRWSTIVTTSNAQPSCGSRRRTPTRPRTDRSIWRPTPSRRRSTPRPRWATWRWRGGSTAELAELALPDARRRRYRALARRYESEQPRRLPAPAFPAALRKKDSYKDIWRDDLIEWELDGDPIAVLARLIAENSDTTVFTRPALRALLKFADPNFSMTNPLVVTDAAEAVGKVPAHEVLRSLKRLFEHSASEVRAAVVRGAEEGLTPRVFDLVRKALGDPAPAVVDAALQLLRKTNFVGALSPLTRIFRESSDERVRLAVLDGIGINWDPLGGGAPLARGGAPGDGRRQASRGGEAGAAGQAGARRGRHAARSGARRGGGRAARGARPHAHARGPRLSANAASRPITTRPRVTKPPLSNTPPLRAHNTSIRMAAPVTIQRRLRCDVWMRAICSRRIRCSSSVTHSTSIGSPASGAGSAPPGRPYGPFVGGNPRRSCDPAPPPLLLIGSPSAIHPQYSA